MYLPKWTVYTTVRNGRATVFIARHMGEYVEVGECDPQYIASLKFLKRKGAEMAAELNESPTYP